MLHLDVLLVHPDAQTVLAAAHRLRELRPGWRIRAGHTVELVQAWLELTAHHLVLTPWRQRAAVDGLVEGSRTLGRPTVSGIHRDLFRALLHPENRDEEEAVQHLLLRLDLMAAQQGPLRFGEAASGTRHKPATNGCNGGPFVVALAS